MTLWVGAASASSSAAVGASATRSPRQLVADAGGQGRPGEPLDRRRHAAARPGLDVERLGAPRVRHRSHSAVRPGCRRRARGHGPAGRADRQVVGTASLLALDEANRAHTRLVFLDAVEPKSADPNAFPDVIDLDYRIVPRYAARARRRPTCPSSLHLDPPGHHAPGPGAADRGRRPGAVAVPAQLDLLGHRARGAGRSGSSCDQPPADPNDAYFIRLLGYAPDPLLSDDRIETFVQPPEESSLPIDPELVRVITPDQSRRQRRSGRHDATRPRRRQRRPLPRSRCRPGSRRQSRAVRNLHLRAAGRSRRDLVDGTGAVRTPVANHAVSSTRRRRCSARANAPSTS